MRPEETARIDEPVPVPNRLAPNRLISLLAELVVVGVAIVNLVAVRATRLPVAYLDDADIHEQMVRFARQSFAHGLDPLTRWFPYLNEGSPQFLHYQSLGAMVTGACGLLVGGDVAFRWSLYLIWALWPVVIYASARIVGLDRWASAMAAAVSPVLMSAPGVGYEVNGYLWIGYGLWAQEWGMLFVPLAWACTWRALADRRWALPAVAAIAATVCSHFETGYLALVATILMPWLVPSDLRLRLGRGALLLVLSLAAAAWAVVPLIVYRDWAAINQALVNGPLVNGYGAGQVMTWLVNGEVFDNGRVAVVSCLVAFGTLAIVWRWRREPVGRALAVMGVFSLLLCWGRTTWGPLMDLVPGGHDVFFRRFMLGFQLAGIFVAGIAVTAVKGVLGAGVGRVARRWGRRGDDAVLVGRVAALLTVPIVALLAIPVVRDVGQYTARNARDVAIQRAEQAPAAAELAPVLRYVEAHGGGRTYAGNPNNWGNNFDVGLVPVYKYIESQDVDEVGFTLRTAALMSQPEFHFDQYDNGDYVVFGVRWLLYPAGQPLPLGARYVMHRGPYWLYELPQDGYVSVVDTVGTISANRRDVGPVTSSLLSGSLLQQHRDLTVAWPGRPAAAPTATAGTAGSPGTVISSGKTLLWGRMPATVHLDRRAVVMLATSFDPGWTATVDGRRAPVQILAPAVVGVTVGPGT
ncbi:MAG: hypothetical protein ACYDEN_03085, partial [Acidimicrobiales bacterium]